MTDQNDVTEYVKAAIQFARTGERIAAMQPSLMAVMTGLDRITELDPELEPEMVAAAEHVTATVEALSRAMTFIDARLQASYQTAGGDPE